jgi:hypothetical protein
MSFTIEEITVLAIYKGKTKAEIINELKLTLPYIEADDVELSDTVINVLRKLKSLTDEELECIDYTQAINEEEAV